MNIDAIVFGSLGTVTETSEIHRLAFNRSFAELGLEWDWSVETYCNLLATTGGANRVMAFAQAHGDTSVTSSTASEVHSHKTRLYADMVRDAPSIVRPGVLRLIAGARDSGLKVGLATSTSLHNIAANLDASDGLSMDEFDVLITGDDLERGKPAPDAHLVCMSKLGVGPNDLVAIEDTADGVASASIAGACVVATPGDYVTDQNFSSAAVTVTSLGDPETQAFIVGDGPDLDGGMVTLGWLDRLTRVFC